MKYTCVICNKVKEGYGNNPFPLYKEGRCCDNCNKYHVIPARLNKYELRCIRCGSVVEVLHSGYCDICYEDMYGK